jgi:hypothetical protein
MFITARRTADELDLELQGDWRATQFQAIEAELQAIDLGGARRARVAPGMAQLDLSGAWLLRDFLERARKAGVESSFNGAVPSALTLVERTYTGEMPARVSGLDWLDPEHAVEQIGRGTVYSWRRLLDGLDFFGCCVRSRAFAACDLSPSHATSTTPASPRFRLSRSSVF